MCALNRLGPGLGAPSRASAEDGHVGPHQDELSEGKSRAGYR